MRTEHTRRLHFSSLSIQLHSHAGIMSKNCQFSGCARPSTDQISALERENTIIPELGRLRRRKLPAFAFARFPPTTTETESRNGEAREQPARVFSPRASAGLNTLGIDVVPREKGHLHQEWKRPGTGRHSSSASAYIPAPIADVNVERERERVGGKGGRSSPHDNEGTEGDTIQEMPPPPLRFEWRPSPTKLETRSYFHTNCNT